MQGRSEADLRVHAAVAGQVDGPEDVLLDIDGNIYCGSRDGYLFRIAAPGHSKAEVLAKMAEGQSNKAIGLDLEISPRTVEIHRANMLSKLAATCTTDALRMYYEDALLIGEAAIPDG